MGRIEKRLRDLGYSLPPVVPEGKLKKGVLVGDLYFSSGIGSPSFRGKLGTDLTVEQGYEAARECCLHLLANMKAVVGDLDKVAKVVKLLCMVNSAPNFGEQPAVANGCTDLLVELYGEEVGKHARSAVGMGALPGNKAVEIEMIAKVTQKGKGK